MTREEAITRIKGWNLDSDEREILAVIIPELRELEDERIRKELKEAFEAYDIESKWNGIPIRSIFAWLEKQKEPTTEELYAEAGTTEKEYIANTMKMVRAMREKQKEQKTAWSEEDELMMKAVIGILDENDHPKLCSWLKSLKPQPKQEWSEEDENARQNLIAHFEGKVLRLSDEAKKEAVDWLKSLRPSWKPSEDLEEAAEEYSAGIIDRKDAFMCKAAFIAGAEWAVDYMEERK